MLISAGASLTLCFTFPEYHSSARCSGTSLPLACSQFSRRLSCRTEATHRTHPGVPFAGGKIGITFTLGLRHCVLCLVILIDCPRILRRWPTPRSFGSRSKHSRRETRSSPSPTSLRYLSEVRSMADQMSSGCATRAIAQVKPTSSRAIAVVTTTFGLPIAARRRYRAHNRACAFQAMSLITGESGSRRS